MTPAEVPSEAAPTPSAIRFESVKQPNGLAITLHEPSLDFVTATGLQQEILDLVRSADFVRVDLGQVRYLDSFGFDALMQLVLACPGMIRFTHATKTVATMFTFAHLGRLLETTAA